MTDTPQRPRFHRFLLYVFIMNLVAALIVGAVNLIAAAHATTTVCGWLPPIYAKMTGRVPCPYSLPDPWAPVPDPVIPPSTWQLGSKWPSPVWLMVRFEN